MWALRTEALAHTDARTRANTHTITYWKIHGIMELFWYRLHLPCFCAGVCKGLFGASICAFSERCLVRALLQNLSSESDRTLERYREDLHDPCL